MRTRFLIVAVLLVTTFTITAQEEPTDSTRPFYMGFTPFPYAISLDAVNFTYDTIAQDADLIVHHFDNGVPWTEALTGERYNANIMNDWEFRRSGTPEDHKVLVTVTPISINRDALAPYRGSEDDMPLPAPFDLYSFDHPDVIAAFIQYCEEAIDFFQPDYFLMGIEVNLLMKLRPDLWDTYMTLHREVYTTLKREYPGLPIMVSVTGIDLLRGYTDADHEDQMRALDNILPYTDYLGLSVYPYMTSYMTNSIPRQIFDQLAALTTKPLAITETGYPAQSFHVSMGTDLQFNSDQQKQAEYIQLLLEEAADYDFRFVVNFVLRDYDELWQAIGGREDLTIVWRDTGLYAEDGTERDSLAIWREWLARDVKQPGIFGG